MKITLTFDSMKEMEEFCREQAGLKSKGTVDQVNIATPIQQAQMPSVGPASIAAPVNQTVIPVNASGGMPIAQTPMQQVSLQQSTQQPVTTPIQNVVPTTAVAQEYSYDQLAVAAAGLMNAGKGVQLHTILQQFGVQAMTELPKERYGEFATAIRAEGAVI